MTINVLTGKPLGHVSEWNDTGMADVVFDWWEAYDEGHTLGQIADRWRVPVRLVHMALVAAEVIDPARGERRAAPTRVSDDLEPLDSRIARLVERPTDDELSAMQAMSLLREVGGGFERDDSRTVAFARSMQHVSARAQQNGRHPMSARQRGQDKLAAAGGIAQIRTELARAGLMTTLRARSVGMYFT